MPVRWGGERGKGTATNVAKAVNDLPMAQASRRDEFAGVNRGGGHRAQSPRCLVVATFAPAGRLHVGRSFTACATTVIAISRMSTRFVHRRRYDEGRIGFGHLPGQGTAAALAQVVLRLVQRRSSSPSSPPSLLLHLPTPRLLTASLPDHNRSLMAPVHDYPMFVTVQPGEPGWRTRKQRTAGLHRACALLVGRALR